MAAASRPFASADVAERAKAAVAGYCRAVDSMDAHAVGEVFAAGGVVRNAAGEFAGRNAIESYFGALFSAEASAGAQSKHLPAGIVVRDIGSGQVEIASSFQFLRRAGAQLMMAWGEYTIVATVDGNAPVLLDSLIISVESPFMVIPYEVFAP